MLTLCEESFCVGTNPLHVSSILQPLEINYDFLARYMFGRYDDVSGRPETALKNVFYLLPRDCVRLKSNNIEKVRINDFTLILIYSV